MLKIKHVSITAKNPQRAAKILAELTDGVSELFPSKTMHGAWLCAWNKQENELVEFIPNTYLLSPGKHAAHYKLVAVEQNFNSTHILLETEKSIHHLRQVAEKHDLYHRYRPQFGGPLYEIWIEQMNTLTNFKVNTRLTQKTISPLGASQLIIFRHRLIDGAMIPQGKFS